MKVILDVSAANPTYRTGASRFTWDLIESMIRRLDQVGAVVVLACSRENVEFYRGISKGWPVELVLIRRKSEAKIRYSLACSIAFMLRSPAIYILLMKAFFFRSHQKLRKIGANAIFTPTCVFNVFLDCPVRLVCIHDMQHEVNPDNFTLATRVARWAPYRAALLHATKVQASSKAMMQELEDIAGTFLTRNLIYIPEFYSKEKFPRMAVAHEWTEKEEKILFYPAQAWPHKNHLFLIRALGEAQAKLNVRFRLVLCGKDFGNIETFRAAAGEANLALDHRGVVTDDELLRCYSTCWAVVLPTRYESSSLPAIEAFAVGALVVASDIPPLREFAENAPTILFTDDDVASFVAAIQRALANEASLRTAMEGGFSAFENTYELENITKGYARELLA